MGHLEDSISFAQNGINKISDENQKVKFQIRLNKLAESINININDILEENTHFNNLEQVKVINSVNAVLANIGTIAQKEISDSEAA